MPMKYSEQLDDFTNNEHIGQLNNYRHHLVYTTLQHAVHVARTSHALSRALHIPVDETAMLRGALLHDYYLYERGGQGVGIGSHYAEHPAVALKNAERDFVLSPIEKNIILSHMWPLNFHERPRSREAWLVSIADKLCSVWESAYGLPAALLRDRREKKD